MTKSVISSFQVEKAFQECDLNHEGRHDKFKPYSIRCDYYKLNLQYPMISNFMRFLHINSYVMISSLIIYGEYNIIQYLVH